MESIQSEVGILRVRELPFEVNREIESITPEVMKGVRFSFLIVLQHIKGKNVVGLHFMVRYTQPDDTVLLHGGATFIAKLAGWEKVEDSETKIKDFAPVLALASYASAFVAGLLYKQAEGSILNSVFLPILPVEELVRNMKIETVTE